MSESFKTSSVAKTAAEPKPKPLNLSTTITKMEGLDKYKSLSSDQKKVLQGHFFDKFVGPTLLKKQPKLDLGQARSMWINSRTGGQPPPKTSILGDIREYEETRFAGMAKAGAGVVDTIAENNKRLAHAVYKNWPFEVKSLAPYARKALREHDRMWNYVSDWADDQRKIADSMLGAHYNNSLMMRAARTEAKIEAGGLGLFAQHPAYVVLPEVAGSVGSSLNLGEFTEKLLEMGPRGKYVYNALKGAAEGYTISKVEGESNKEARKNAKIFIGFELGPPALGAIGRDFGITEALQANKAKAISFLGKLIGVGRFNGLSRTMAAATKATPEELTKADPNKLSTKLVVAGRQVLDEVSVKLGYKNFDAAKEAGATEKVMAGVQALVHQANEEVGAHNPELIAAEVAKEQKELASTPLGAKVIGLAQKYGVDPVGAATNTVIENVKTATGANAKENAHQAVENASTVLEDLVRGLGPGAASARQKEAVDTLLHIVETNLPLQSRANYFTFIWGIRHNIPKELLPILKQEMKDIYGHDEAMWDQATVKLDQHIDDLIATGHIKPNDPRGVFASTKFVGEPTKWQDQLAKELEKVKALKRSKEGGIVDAEKVAGGKLKMGADPERLGRILGSSLYHNRGPQVVVKELLQNAYDATRSLPKGQGKVSVEFFDSYVPGKPSHFVITDNGKGMTPDDIYTVFTDLGSSGKAGEEEASGGFGLAKAAPFMVADELKVETIGTTPEGNKVKTVFTSTPDDILKGEVVPSVYNMPRETPTGTKITATFNDKESLYDARSFAMDSKRSRNAPAELTLQQTTRWGGTTEIGTDIKDARVHVAKVDVPNSSTINIYKSSEKSPLSKALGNLQVEIHNNGIYQFTKTEWLGNGMQLRGMPSRIIMDVRATVPEGHEGYPFEANREGLRGETEQAVTKAINDVFVRPASERLKKEIGEVYRNLPTLSLGGGRTAPIFDAGSRLKPEELKIIQNDPTVARITNAFDNVAGDMIERLKGSPIGSYLGEPPSSYLGKKVERVGIVLSDKVHGVHIKSPTGTESSMFINPFQYDPDATPDQIASLMHHTIKHELIHDMVGGHNETFTSIEAKVSHFLGFEHEYSSMKRILDAYSADGVNIRPEFSKTLQIYRESRGRSEVTPDILGGEELTAKPTD